MAGEDGEGGADQGGASAQALCTQAHAEYIAAFQRDKGAYEYVASEYLRLSGIYWGTTALRLLGKEALLPAGEVVADVMRCWNEAADGGFASAEGHDSHLLYTLSAVQVLVTHEAWPELDRVRDPVTRYVASLQRREDGAFFGDRLSQEVDTRFSYCALSCLSLLGTLGKGPDGEKGPPVDLDAAAGFVLSCQNFDGGFGARPGDETHAGQVFVCVGALDILGKAAGAALGQPPLADRLDADRLGWWLCERQTPGGGLNGRPQKLQDVCYTWWVLSSLSMMGKLHWVHRDSLVQFILDCQDPIDGGISDRPDDEVDIFHTFFGVAGLSLLGYGGLEPVDATYAMPVNTLSKLRERQLQHNCS